MSYNPILPCYSPFITYQSTSYGLLRTAGGILVGVFPESVTWFSPLLTGHVPGLLGEWAVPFSATNGVGPCILDGCILTNHTCDLSPGIGTHPAFAYPGIILSMKIIEGADLKLPDSSMDPWGLCSHPFRGKLSE